jgi:hypothetical protein
MFDLLQCTSWWGRGTFRSAALSRGQVPLELVMGKYLPSITTSYSHIHTHDTKITSSGHTYTLVYMDLPHTHTHWVTHTHKN